MNEFKINTEVVVVFFSVPFEHGSDKEKSRVWKNGFLSVDTCDYFATRIKITSLFQILKAKLKCLKLNSHKTYFSQVY